MSEKDCCDWCGAKAVWEQRDAPGLKSMFVSLRCECGSEHVGPRTAECVQRELTQLRQFRKVVMDNVDRVTVTERYHGGSDTTQYYVVKVGHVMLHKDVKKSFEGAVQLKAKGI